MSSLQSAYDAQEQGLLKEWVIDYLYQSGDNDKLAKDLMRQGHYNTGLVYYPINQLEKLLGPDKSFDYYEEPSMYEHRVESMVESIKNGWKPAPLIASKIWNNDFELHDGAHRAEALRRAGIETYPTIFYFETKEQLDDFTISLSALRMSGFIA